MHKSINTIFEWGVKWNIKLCTLTFTLLVKKEKIYFEINEILIYLTILNYFFYNFFIIWSWHTCNHLSIPCLFLMLIMSMCVRFSDWSIVCVYVWVCVCLRVCVSYLAEANFFHWTTAVQVMLIILCSAVAPLCVPVCCSFNMHF